MGFDETLEQVSTHYLSGRIELVNQMMVVWLGYLAHSRGCLEGHVAYVSCCFECFLLLFSEGHQSEGQVGEKGWQPLPAHWLPPHKMQAQSRLLGISSGHEHNYFEMTFR